MATQNGRAGGTMLVPLAVQAMSITLQKYNIPFAFTGNLACSIYGEALRPTVEKIDILLLSSDIIVSELTHLLVQNHPAHFTYHGPAGRLQYRNIALMAENASRGEIDIVFTVSPFGNGAYLRTVNGVPLVPYSIILLEQLHVWDNTSTTLEKMKLARADVLQMLKVFRRREDFQHQPVFDERLQTASVQRVARFFQAHPSYRKEWQRMGLIQNRERPVAVPKVRKDGRPEPVVLNETRASPSPVKDPLPRSPHERLTTPSATPTSLPQHPRVIVEAPGPPPPDTPVAKKPEKLSRMQIRRLAARSVVDILQAHGFPSAIFGSMACKLYGNRRTPNDVDILVLPPPMHTLQGLPPTQETLKDLLVASAPSKFVLKPARDPDAAYRVLWFVPTPDTKPTPKKATKVDVLLPGVMHLPALPATRVYWRGGPDPNVRLPVLPFAVLLLQKLQGWDDHRKAEEERYLAKVDLDVADLEWMLGNGVGKYMGDGRRGRGGVWDERVLFSEEFEGLSRERVRAFCEAHPRWASVWRGLGFEVP